MRKAKSKSKIRKTTKATKLKSKKPKGTLKEQLIAKIVKEQKLSKSKVEKAWELFELNLSHSAREKLTARSTRRRVYLCTVPTHRLSPRKVGTKAVQVASSSVLRAVGNEYVKRLSRKTL